MQNLVVELERFLAQRESDGSTLTLVTGVFDLLHEEHRLFLEKAKALGDLLLVGLESDVRVRQMKGEGRPIHDVDSRRRHLTTWGLADFIFILPEQFSQPADHRRLIAQIRPDFMAVSSHTRFLAEKQQILSEFGAKLVVVHEHNPLLSSSILLEERGRKNARKE